MNKNTQKMIASSLGFHSLSMVESFLDYMVTISPESYFCFKIYNFIEGYATERN